MFDRGLINVVWLLLDDVNHMKSTVFPFQIRVDCTARVGSIFLVRHWQQNIYFDK